MEEFILKERETRETIAEIINESRLPAVTLKAIFKDILEELNVVERQQYWAAIENMKKEAKNEKK